MGLIPIIRVRENKMTLKKGLSSSITSRLSSKKTPKKNGLWGRGCRMIAALGTVLGTARLEPISATLSESD
jgi:hypothetical protein